MATRLEIRIYVDIDEDSIYKNFEEVQNVIYSQLPEAVRVDLIDEIEV